MASVSLRYSPAITSLRGWTALPQSAAVPMHFGTLALREMLARRPPCLRLSYRLTVTTLQLTVDTLQLTVDTLQLTVQPSPLTVDT